MTISGEVH